ncbi:hypothetical protein JYT83_01050, partial [bacterium AH-315-F18]|nr:hypothetical protein [bacterium AH-315-F18]
ATASRRQMKRDVLEQPLIDSNAQKPPGVSLFVVLGIILSIPALGLLLVFVFSFGRQYFIVPAPNQNPQRAQTTAACRMIVQAANWARSQAITTKIPHRIAISQSVIRVYRPPHNGAPINFVGTPYVFQLPVNLVDSAHYSTNPNAIAKTQPLNIPLLQTLAKNQNYIEFRNNNTVKFSGAYVDVPVWTHPRGPGNGGHTPSYSDITVLYGNHASGHVDIDSTTGRASYLVP